MVKSVDVIYIDRVLRVVSSAALTIEIRLTFVPVEQIIINDVLKELCINIIGVRIEV